MYSISSHQLLYKIGILGNTKGAACSCQQMLIDTANKLEDSTNATFLHRGIETD